MKNELLHKIKKEFPDKCNQKKYSYEVDLEDLNKLFDLINEYAFNGKLDRNLVDINVFEKSTTDELGQFALGAYGTNRCVINIKNDLHGNIFGKVVSVMCHEMIHMYDRYFGELKKKLLERNQTYDIMDVNNIGNKQYVYGYDVHGKYFHEWLAKFDRLGIIVKVNYNDKDKKYMKKIDESFDFFNGEKLEESENIDNPNLKAHLENVFNSLEGCPNKDFKYYDENHWYIRID